MSAIASDFCWTGSVQARGLAVMIEIEWHVNVVKVRYDWRWVGACGKDLSKKDNCNAGAG